MFILKCALKLVEEIILLLWRLYVLVVVIRGKLEKYISIIHILFIDFVSSLNLGVKLCYQCLCLLTDVLFLSMLFLETSVCFHIMPYYDSFSYSNSWIIDKVDTQWDGFFLNMF